MSAQHGSKPEDGPQAETEEVDLYCPSCGLVLIPCLAQDGSINVWLHTYDGEMYFCDVCDPLEASPTIH